MSTSFKTWDNSIHQLEAGWLKLLEVTNACKEEGLVDQTLLQYELEELRGKLNTIRCSHDPTEAEACLAQCQNLQAYYAALRSNSAHEKESV